MHHALIIVLTLLFSSLMLAVLAQKIKIAYPIFLVVAGLLISFIPGLPKVHLNPELIFLVFLPPLLYEAAWYTSWNDFWKWRRVISMLAFGLVLITSLVVAFVSQALIPGFTLAMGFLLGGIISPPDAVAANTVLKNLKVPKALSTILEGESLINDASSLIVFRFALAAVVTGSFSVGEAVGDFFIVAGMGIVTGVVIAIVIFKLHRILPSIPAVDATLTVMTPYIMYLVAEEFHFSGVLAVVSGGLFISYRSHKIFDNGATRMNMLGVWTTLVFVLNVLVFILIGLELPDIISGLGEYAIIDAIQYGLIISAVVIAIRILWILPVAYIPKWLGQKNRMDTVNPTWKGPLLVGWAGMRGVVSLATALSIPLLLDSGEAFPHRNLILLITFIVIFVTLVFQGITLPFLVKWLNIKDFEKTGKEGEEHAGIQLRLKQATLKKLEQKYSKDEAYVTIAQQLVQDVNNDITRLEQQLEELNYDEIAPEEQQKLHAIMHDIILVKRDELFKLRKEKHFSDEEIRRQEYLLDLEELTTNHLKTH